MSVFYLVRHGHAAWTPDKDRPLSERGHRGAQRVAEILAQAPIDAVYASTMRRAQQTVAPLAARLGLQVQVTPALDERRLSGPPVADDAFQAAVRATWDDYSFAHPGGETNAAAQRRGVALVECLAARHPEGQYVLGTHGNLLALVLRRYWPAVDYVFWQSLTMPDIYGLELQPAVGSQLATADNPARSPRVTRLWTEQEKR